LTLWSNSTTDATNRGRIDSRDAQSA